MKRRFITLFIILCLVLTTRAQCMVTYDAHGLLPDNSFSIEVVNYTNPGLPGEGRIWDFSQVPVIENDKRHYMMSSDSLSLLSTDRYRLYTYNQRADSLLLLREENNLFFIDYTQPQLVICYPMQYGDIVQQGFNGHGVYCGRIFLRRIGTTVVEADGQGTLIRTEGDTIRNVLRIHSVTTALLYQRPDLLTDDSETCCQEFTELYQWYAQGLRHPVYEMLSITYSNDDVPYAYNQTARRYMAMPSDNTSDEELKQDGQRSAEDFSFSLSNARGRVTIDYKLSETACMQIIVADAMGMLHRSETIQAEAGNHQHAIDCSALKPGQYVVYININGKVYNSKFTQQ